MRHGKPTFTGARKVACREMPDWIAQYNLSDTGNDSPPESSSVPALKALQVISSPLPRAISSLKALGYEPDLIAEVFREADLPVYFIPGMRLSPLCWASLFRFMWICGMSRKAESFRMAKSRAARAADILVKLAGKHNGPVLLMGHGIMNRLIAKQLISSGWKEQSRSGSGYWSAGIYKLQEEKF